MFEKSEISTPLMKWQEDTILFDFKKEQKFPISLEFRNSMQESNSASLFLDVVNLNLFRCLVVFEKVSSLKNLNLVDKKTPKKKQGSKKGKTVIDPDEFGIFL